MNFSILGVLVLLVLQVHLVSICRGFRRPSLLPSSPPLSLSQQHVQHPALQPHPSVVLSNMNPPWPPTYDMAMSTWSMACNSHNWSSPERGSAFGVVSYDWSNQKAAWAKARPMDSGKMLLEQARRVKALNTSTRVFVYRNIVKALPWFAKVREILDDPAYSGFFLKFGTGPTHVPMCAAENATKCSVYYHDQEQTPEVAPGSDGICNADGCDCGLLPCGEYLFDYRNGTQLQDWIVNELILGETAIGAPEVDGLFLDDFYCSDLLCKEDPRGRPCPCSDPVQGASEIDLHQQADMGLSDEDIRDITLGWERAMAAVQRAILKAGAYTWSLMLGQANANAYPQMLSANASKCSIALRDACQPSSSWQTLSVLFGVTVANETLMPQFEQDLAFFLLARGNYSWLGWGQWGMTWPVNPEPAHGELPPLPHGVPRPAALEVDYGTPLGLCTESETTRGVFTRKWTKADVQLDCNAFKARIVHHDDEQD